MSGAIVVEGIEKHLPALGKMRQRLIIVRATGNGSELRRRTSARRLDGPDADGDRAPAEQQHLSRAS